MSGNVTIKGGTGYDVPWLVIEAPADGSAESKVEAQRAYILAAFGMDPADPDIVDLSLAEVVAQASVHFQGVWAAAQGLGATPGSADLGVARKPAKAAPKARAGVAKSQTVQAAAAQPQPEVAPEPEATAPEPEPAAEPAAEEHPFQEVLDEIAGATSKKALQAIFHGNKAAMADASVLDALKARTKEVGA